MAVFTAQERTPAVESVEVKKVPAADRDGLRYMGDSKFFLYHDDKHAERDLLRPGFFDGVVDGADRAFHGALIMYSAAGGEKDPADWRTGILRIVRVRGARGVSSHEPTLVAIVARFHKATTVGHDGEADGGTH